MSELSVSSLLQQCGVRPSHQRLTIMSYLLGTREHPTADEVYNALAPTMPTLSKATVYNTLNLLSSQGAVKMLTINPAEKRFDGFTHSHAHMLCENCGRLIDIDLTAKEVAMLDGIAPEHDIRQRELYLKGACTYCANIKKN